MEELHRHNAERLRRIIAAHGWPGETLAGPDGAAAAWRIVQHSIGEPQFMRKCLVLIRDAVQAGEADGRQLAMLEDRIRVFEGRPQLYGTQYDWNEAADAMVPMGSVEDPETVDARRSAVGLPPLKWRRPLPPGEPPPARSLEEREREPHEWASKAGWRGEDG